MGIINKTLYCEENNAVATLLSYFSHPGRIKIILLLLTNESLTLGQIRSEIGLSQSATSDQIRVLKEAGLISGRSVGTSMYYNIQRENWEFAKQFNDAFWDSISEL